MASFLQSIIISGQQSGSHACGVTHFTVAASSYAVVTFSEVYSTIGLLEINGHVMTPDLGTGAAGTPAVWKDVYLGPGDVVSTTAGSAATLSWWGVTFTNSV